MAFKDKSTALAYQRKWLAKRRSDFFADKSCLRCGSTLNLELDHREPKEKVTNAIWSLSADKRYAEIAKCDVLCRICHEKKTTDNDIHRTVHGALQMYRRGCRCELCVSARLTANRNSHSKNPNRIPRRGRVNWSTDMDDVAMSLHCGAAAAKLGIPKDFVYRRRQAIKIKNPDVRYPYQDLPDPIKSGD